MENEPKIFTTSDMERVQSFAQGFHILTWICMGLALILFFFGLFLNQKIEKLKSEAVNHGFAKYTDARHNDIEWYSKMRIALEYAGYKEVTEEPKK